MDGRDIYCNGGIPPFVFLRTRGDGVEKNRDEAISWLRTATEQWAVRAREYLKCIKEYGAAN
jgi:hypothetical protein